MRDFLSSLALEISRAKPFAAMFLMPPSSLRESQSDTGRPRRLVGSDYYEKESKKEKVFARESDFKPEQEKKKKEEKSFHFHVHSGKCQSMTSPGPAVRADADAQFGSCHCTGVMYGVLPPTTS